MKEGNLTVSVIVPVYNRDHSISAAIKSIQSQTYNNWEVVVVDDGSTDNTSHVVREMAKKDKRIRAVRYDKRKGAQAARNTGIRTARGHWTAFLDSDDHWLPRSLEDRLMVAQREKVKVVHSECYVIRGNERLKLFGVRPMSGSIYRDILIEPAPMFQGLLVARDAWQTIGYLDERIISYQEWDTAIRLAKHYEFGFLGKPTFLYDCRGTDTISSDQLRDVVGYEQVFRKHRLSILRHAGSRSLADHYRTAAAKYHRAGVLNSERRCNITANILEFVDRGWHSSRQALRWFKQ